MNKIKVLRIVGEYNSGGVENIALNYYKNIDHSKIGMDFLFYGDSHKSIKEEFEKNGDKVINVTDYKDSMLKSIKDIEKVVREGNYDIVHSQMNALNVFPLYAAKRGGAKIRIASNHSTANLKYEFKKSLVKYILRPTIGLFATNYSACSKYAAKWAFGKRKLKSDKMKIIHNAIDLNKFKYDANCRKKIRKEYNWDDKFVIGNVGRFVKQKNHKFLIDIFEKIKLKKENSLLVLIGVGDLQESIKNYVHEKNLDDSVVFLGMRFDVDKLMNAMDLFLFPSIYEGLGNVVTEAQAISLYTLASDVVPEEVKMSEYVEFMSLNENAEKWAEHALKHSSKYKRRNTFLDLKNNGYEIRSAAKDLEKYYFSLIEEKHK